MTNLLLIFAAGGAGCVLRYLLSIWVQRISGGTFPLGTICVNLLGCLCAGALAAMIAQRVIVREEIRIVAGFGFLGGFTTFSAFGYETFALLAAGQVGRALANVALSVILGIAAIWIGIRLVGGPLL